LDSRGNPTVEAELELEGGFTGRAIVPSGASKGQREALELRDGDKRRFGGKGVLKAVGTVNETLAKRLVGQAYGTITALDTDLLAWDPSPQKTELGGNAILSVSLAFANALALAEKKPLYEIVQRELGLERAALRLPVPLMNVINGGEHADNGLEFQEFMLVPHGFSTFRESLRAGAEVFHALRKWLSDRSLGTAVGDEGGFAPKLQSNEQALEAVAAAVEAAGYRLGDQIALALDVASSSFYDESQRVYRIRVGGKESVDAGALVDFYVAMAKKFPIVSIEDGLAENDWTGWAALTRTLGNRVQLVGDDLFVTQARYVRKGIEEKSANAVLVKINQAGSLKETFETLALCRSAHWNAIVSHRSGESEDVSIAHIAVGSGCGQIKTGSLSRSERTAKYNELLRIEDRAEQAKNPIAFATPFRK
jgi:enolase